MISSLLEAAFVATTYRVEANGIFFALRIGKCSPEFDDLLAEAGVEEWTIVTAHNPGGFQSSKENRLCEARFDAYLDSSKLHFYEVGHVADDGKWPEERGRLVLGLNEVEACRLGRTCRQTAVVCGNRGGVPRLVWLGV